ncbi:response regulator transcription factor [Nibrella viscosa]|uniref:Response regulator transcription factor n=1 Tax=Nibrella viscosa TaxID=1084524 RepID=A0ABP8JXH9_9BACT
MPQTILLADDHQLFLDGLRLLFDRIDGWEVVGEASNGIEVLAFLETHTVDCVVLDIQMPMVDGIEATRRIKKGFPQVKVLGVSMVGDYGTIRKMLQAGADGYLVKDTGIAELRYALDMVTKGQIFVSHQLAPVLLEGVAGRKAKPASARPGLTKREQEIIQLIVNGQTNEQIATALFLSPLTITTHRKRILTKLGCKNTAMLVRYVLENKLVEK